MMGRDESWWQSRTGLEQKLVILSTILFILSFSLTISVIVIKNRTPSGGSAAATTLSPTEATTVSGETPTTEPTSPVSESTTEEPASSSAKSEEPPASTSETASAASSASTSEASSAATSEASSAATSEASSAATSDASTKVTEPPVKPEEKDGADGPGSINSRPARYIPLPRGLANLHEEVLGA